MAHLAVTPRPVLPANDHYASDHLSSHTGERTSNHAGHAFRHVQPPFLRGQESVRDSKQVAPHCPSLNISFALMDNACLVLSNATNLLVSRVALAAPCICFLRLRVGQLSCVGPVWLTHQILNAAPRSLLESGERFLCTKGAKRNALSPSGEWRIPRRALSPSGGAVFIPHDPVRFRRNRNLTRVTSPGHPGAHHAD